MQLYHKYMYFKEVTSTYVPKNVIFSESIYASSGFLLYDQSNCIFNAVIWRWWENRIIWQKGAKVQDLIAHLKN